MAPIVLHHPDYQAPLRADHRFPMSKYGYLREILLARGLAAPDVPAPSPASAALLAGAHDPDYVSRAFALALRPDEIRRIGLPMTERVIRRARLAAAGTLMAGNFALERGIALNAAGGAHHARAEGGAGFSTFNDVAVAARALRAAGRARRIFVLDCDVHQGDGVAAIFAEEPAVFTLSIHAEKNFPLRKARSDLDLGLPDGTGDGAYLAALEATLERGLDAALAGGPLDLAFYNAGVDVHAEDRLGRLGLSDAGIAARDALALRLLRRRGIPVAVVMGGGYGPDPRRIAARHVLVFEAAARRSAAEQAAETPR